MSYRTGLLLAALAVSACGGTDSAAAGPPPIRASFDTAIDGWSLRAFGTDANIYNVDPGLASQVTWDPAGGHPGGAIARQDFIGQTDYFETPAAFHGDLSEYYGGTISFDLRDSSSDGPFNAPLLLLQGGGSMWRYDGGPNVATGWTTFRAPLSASAPGWTLVSTGAAATEAALRQSLGATTGLWLRAEFSNAQDNSWLDNVVLGP